MKVIEIECSRIVHYSKNIELTDEQADHFQEAFDSQDKREIQQCLEEWIDTRYDVTDADDYEVLNASIDGEALYL